MLTLQVVYPLNIPIEVMEDVEQELYVSVFGDESGEAELEMFVDPDNHPSLKKWLSMYGVTGRIRVLATGKISG